MKDALALVLIMLGVTGPFQCAKKQEQNPQRLQSRSNALAVPEPAAPAYGSGHWPSFRGDHASGVADGQNLPDTWNAKSGEHIRWKTRIPGLAHSSPVIWGDRIFVTTAVSSRQDASFRHGLYGDGDASDDRSVHEWKLFCLNKQTGEVIWERLVTRGIPVDKRHIKATYANSTPATNGSAVIALFGSEGLFAYNTDGQFLWKKDLGRINCGAYDAPEFEWGSSSSPIIFQNSVIVQVDTQDDDYLIALNIKTGETIWKTERDELPSWGTPAIVQTKEWVELVTNSSNFIYGYDPKTGEELWRLGGSSKITAPTPVYQDSLIIVCSGRGPEAPIFAVRTGASGTITLKESETSNQDVVWSKTRQGPYMPTPVIYRGLLYTVNNNGQFRCYEFDTGKEFYEVKLPHRGGGFSASPVAADGKLYLASEDGDIFVVQAGSNYRLIAANDMDELLMATPALSGGLMIVRAQYHVLAISQ